MSSIGPSGQSRGWLARLEPPTPFDKFSADVEAHRGEPFDDVWNREWEPEVVKRRAEWEALAENT